MLQPLILFLLTWGLAELLTERHREQLRHPRWVFTALFFWHSFFALAYYTYAQFNRSDSYAYLERALGGRYGYTWLEVYGTGTRFVTWLTYPFADYLDFSYESLMILFSFFGFVGFLYLYLFIVRETRFRHRLWGIDFILVLLFLPNMHFWTVSLGKGSVTFMGVGLLLYGVISLSRNPLPFLLGSLVVFHVRPHIFLVFLLAAGIGMLFSTKRVKVWQKVLALLVAGLLFGPILQILFNYAKIDDANSDAINDFISHRSSELQKAGSAVDIGTYNQPLKLFTFWFRPLFVDAPNALGLFISVENLLYLFLLIKLVSRRFLSFLLQSPWLVKAACIAFLGVSIALAQISSNLGLAIRQKQQVMYLILFVLIAYADWMYQRYGKEVI